MSMSRPSAQPVGPAARALEITVQAADGLAVTVVTTHLKSKLLSYPGPATAVSHLSTSTSAPSTPPSRATGAPPRPPTVRARVALDGQRAERALVVAGDLNDEPDATSTLLLSRPPGSEIGTRGFRRPDHSDADRLWNPRRAHQTARTPSHPRLPGRGEFVDHILASGRRVDPAATPSSPPSPLVTSPRLATTPAVAAKPSSRTTPPSSPASGPHGVDAGSYATVLAR
jgi:endonuclease/exonuclease/phosphatase family metal-dependent hydrolase